MDDATASLNADLGESPADAPPPLGHNLPPSEIEILRQALEEETLDLFQKKMEVEADIPYIPEVIQDEAQAKKLSDWLKKTRGVISSLNERRADRKRPFDDLAATVQTYFTGLINPLKKAMEDIKPRLTDFQQRMEEAARQRALEEQRKREENERRLREEADRKAKEAAEAEAKARAAREAEAKAKREKEEAEKRAAEEQRKAAEAEVARKEAERVAAEERKKAEAAREERERAEKKAREETARAEAEKLRAEAARLEAEESERKRKAAERAQAEAEERERKAKEREAEAERLRLAEAASQEAAAKARAAAEAATQTAALAQQSADTAETAVDAAHESAKAHGVVAKLNEKAAAGGLREAIKTDQAADREGAAAGRAERQYLAKPSELATIHGDFNSTAVPHRRWVHGHVDRDIIDLEALRAHLPQDAIDQAIRSFIDAGGRKLRGTHIFEETETHIR